MKHTKNLTQSFRAIPPARFREKLQRTIGGVLLAAFGLGLLYLQEQGFLGKSIWVERTGTAAVALGCLSASFEFIKAPLEYTIAIAKDIMDLVRGKNEPSA